MSESPAASATVADIVVADFYRDIADGLLASCREKLTAAGCAVRREYRVAGALEIPPLVRHIAAGDNDPPPVLLVALGCVIRGETYHFEVVSQTCAAGIMQAQMQTGVPVGNGVLTVENREQALARLAKGGAAAEAALSLARAMRRL